MSNEHPPNNVTTINISDNILSHSSDVSVSFSLQQTIAQTG